MSNSLTTEALSTRQRWYREEYLRSPHWRALRSAKFKQAPNCEMCGAHRRLDVHHASYERLGAEELSDLTTLCRPCHAQVHARVPISEHIAIERRIMDLAIFKQSELRRSKREEQKRRNIRKRHRKGDAFASYAFHCLRAIRQGFASPEDYNFVRLNKSDIARLRV